MKLCARAIPSFNLLGVSKICMLCYVCMSVCVCVCMREQRDKSLLVHTHTYEHTHTHKHTHTNTHTHTHAHAHTQLYLDSQYWGIILDALQIYTPIMILLDAFALMTAFFAKGLIFKFFCLVVKRLGRCAECLRTSGWIIQLILLVLLFLMCFCALFMFAFGVILWLVHFVFAQGCKEASTYVGGICINLDEFGFDAIYWCVLCVCVCVCVLCVCVCYACVCVYVCVF